MNALRTILIEWGYLVIAGLFGLIAIFCFKAGRNPLEQFRIYARTGGATFAVLAVLCLGVFAFVTWRQLQAVRQLSSMIKPYPGAKYSSRHQANGEEVWIWETRDDPKKIAAYYSSGNITSGARFEQAEDGELVIHKPPKRIRILPMTEGGTSLLVYRIKDE